MSRFELRCLAYRLRKTLIPKVRNQLANGLGRLAGYTAQAASRVAAS
jgi:glucan phosphorylase